MGFNDTRGTLFFEIERIISHHKPKILLLENVKNFQNHNNGETMEIVCSSLSDLGYDVFYKILNSGNYGIPQKRERIYFVCFHNSLNIKDFTFPTPLKEFKVLNDVLIKNEFKYIDREDVQIFNNNIIERIGNPIRIGIVGKGGQGERIYHPNGHAITLSAYGGGVGSKTGLYKINDKIRKLQPRECARVMGFPDTFVLHELSSQSYKQFGNSVVVNVLQYIIKNIIRRLEKSGKDNDSK